MRVFKGTYEISSEMNGEIIRDTVEIINNQSLEIVADNITTNTEDLLQQKQIKVYPNPVKDQLTIELPGQQVHTLQLLDITGKLLHEQNIQSTSTLSLGHLNLSGIFILKVKNEQTTRVQKIIVD